MASEEQEGESAAEPKRSDLVVTIWQGPTPGGRELVIGFLQCRAEPETQQRLLESLGTLLEDAIRLLSTAEPTEECRSADLNAPDAAPGD